MRTHTHAHVCTHTHTHARAHTLAFRLLVLCINGLPSHRQPILHKAAGKNKFVHALCCTKNTITSPHPCQTHETLITIIMMWNKQNRMMGVPKMNSNNMVQSVILFLKILLTSYAAHWILNTNYRWCNYWACDPVEKKYK